MHQPPNINHQNFVLIYVLFDFVQFVPTLILILDEDDYGWRVISGGVKKGDGCLDPSNWSKCDIPSVTGTIIMLLVVFSIVHNYCSLKFQIVSFLYIVLPGIVVVQ